jgi:hypothetical protein
MGEVLASLRRIIDDAHDGPSFEAVRSVVDYLCGRSGPLCEGPEAVGAPWSLSEREVGDMVADLGSCLARTSRASSGAAVRPRKAKRLATVAEYEERTGQTAPRAAVTADGLVDLPMHTSEEVVLPLGWERGAIGRELQRAVASIVCNDPDDDTLRRWLEYRYSRSVRHPDLTYPLLATTRLMAALGRAHELEELAHMGDGPSPNTAALFINMWEFLEGSRADAVRAIEVVCSSGDHDEVLSALVDCRWIAEAEIGRLERALEHAKSSPTLKRSADADLRSFAAAVEEYPLRYKPPLVGDMLDSQLLKLCQSAGISTEPPADYRPPRMTPEWVRTQRLLRSLSGSAN